SLADTDKSEAAFSRFRLGEAAPVVLDLESYRSSARRQDDAHGLRFGVLNDIRQSFLNDRKMVVSSFRGSRAPGGRSIVTSTFGPPRSSRRPVKSLTACASPNSSSAAGRSAN